MAKTAPVFLPGIKFLDNSFTNDRLSEALNRDESTAYSVVHLASHFHFRPGKESESFLVTGGGGRLTMDDLKYGEFPFHNVDLLTLSACNTGLGGVGADGSEIEGFGALAQNQGAAAVMATLWSVADESTGQFMSQFYNIREAEQLSKVATIQKVQQQFIDSSDEENDYSHPFFWAPFIVMGNWL